MIRSDIPVLKLPLDAQTLLKTPRDTKVSRIDGGHYTHFGLKQCIVKIIKAKKKRNARITKIELIVFVDDAPLDKSSE